MKVKNTMAAPLTGGNMLTENIGISDNAEDQMMVLNILTKSVYTDPIAAVLREYGCNAFDANVEAGKGDRPIQVRLPNKLDPSLSIRDFGHGMTQEQVVTVFCRLGRSTKRDSNAFTGMLGIGSKAGFAYGDQFMVISYSKGTKTIYNAYRDKGMPKLARMHEEHSTEPDGMEIKVPVREEDMQEFVEKAERVYRYFRVLPEVTGAKLEWSNRKQEFEGTGWRFLGRGQKSVAIMGNVGYNLDGAALGVGSDEGRSYYRNNNESPEAALLNLGIELDFSIGELEVSASREGLQYDDETKKVLLARMKIVIAEVGKIMSGKIANMPSMWEAKKAFNTLFDGLSSVNHYELNRVIGHQIMWGGKAVNSSEVNLENNNNIADVSVTRFSRHHRGRTPLGTIRTTTWPSPHRVNASDAVALVINDLATKKNAPARMRGCFERNTTIADIIVFAFGTTKAHDEYWKEKELTGAPTILLSSIAPQVVAKGQAAGASAHKSKHSARVFALNEATPANSDYRTKSLWWEHEDVDLKDDAGVYVEIENFSIKAPNSSWVVPWEFVDTVKSLRAAGMISGKVYGFKPDRIPKLGGKWVRLEVNLKAKMDKLVKSAGFAQEIADYIAVSEYVSLLPDSSVTLFPQGDSVRLMLDEQVRMRKPRQKKLLELIQSGEIEEWLPKPTLPKPSVNLLRLEQAALKDHPMLEIISNLIASYNWKMQEHRLQKLDLARLNKIAQYVAT